jgi:hypothetical protein
LGFAFSDHPPGGDSLRVFALEADEIVEAASQMDSPAVRTKAI